MPEPALGGAEEKAPNPGIEVPGETSNNFEEVARSKGWRPKEEFNGDDENWVNAEEFVKREPLFERIKSQSKELRELRKTVESMASHYHKSVESQVKRAVAELKTKRREAIELGDADKVEAIDEEIEKTTKEAAEAKPAVDDGPPEEITQWIAENKWYSENEDMRTFAIAFNEQYLRKNPGELGASLKKTTEAVKRAFPEEFEKRNPKREQPGAVESPSGPSATQGGSKQYSVNRLTQDQKMVYNQYVKVHKIMSHDEYFKSLEDIGELQ